MPIPVTAAHFGEIAADSRVDQPLGDSVRLASAVGLDVLVVADQNRAHDVRVSLSRAGLVDAATVLTAGVRASRNACLSAGLKWLQVHHVDSAAVVLHEPMRPLADIALWRELVELAGPSVDAALPSTPVVDSVKAIDENGIVQATVDRALLRAVEFPRVFSQGVLRRGLEQVDSRPFDEVEFVMTTNCAVEIIEVDRAVFAASFV